MNIILFEPQEMGAPLPRRDPRAVHLLKVLHKKRGDTFDAGVLGGPRGTGTIEALESGGLLVSLDLEEAPPPRIPLRMAVGFPRPIQLRRLLRDLANLGLEAVDLLGTDLGEKSYRDTTLLTDGGARAALIEGAVQARDTILPRLRVYPNLDAWLQDLAPATGVEAAAAPRRIAADNVRPQGSFAGLGILDPPLTLAVGAERGWSDRERDLLEAAGFRRLSLGERALRTETACIAAAVLAMEKIGGLG
jgi:RsmE family RNA methyltransferase